MAEPVGYFGQKELSRQKDGSVLIAMFFKYSSKNLGLPASARTVEYGAPQTVGTYNFETDQTNFDRNFLASLSAKQDFQPATSGVKLARVVYDPAKSDPLAYSSVGITFDGEEVRSVFSMGSGNTLAFVPFTNPLVRIEVRFSKSYMARFTGIHLQPKSAIRP